MEALNLSEVAFHREMSPWITHRLVFYLNMRATLQERRGA